MVSHLMQKMEEDSTRLAGSLAGLADLALDFLSEVRRTLPLDGPPIWDTVFSTSLVLVETP